MNKFHKVQKWKIKKSVYAACPIKNGLSCILASKEHNAKHLRTSVLYRVKHAVIPDMHVPNTHEKKLMVMSESQRRRGMVQSTRPYVSSGCVKGRGTLQSD